MKKTFSQNHPKSKNQPQKLKQQVRPYVKNTYFFLTGSAVIILLGIIIYSNSFKCSFHFDDLQHIVNNTFIQKISDVKAWWNYSPERPVSMFSFVLNYHFNQLDVWYYHLVNLVIHLTNSFLAWWLTILIFSAPAMKGHVLAPYRNSLGFITALLFVSHPLATQSVTYIMQRQNTMAAMFYFASLAFYMQSRLSAKTKKIKYLFLSFSLISGVLAVFSKENAFTIPLAVLMFEIFFFQTPRQLFKINESRKILFVIVPLLFIVILFFKFSLGIFNRDFFAGIFNPIPPDNGNLYTITPSNYLLTQFSVIVKYIQLLIFPIRQNLDYDFPVSTRFFELKTFFSFLLLVSLLILGMFLYKKQRIFSFGIFWFFLTLSIESGFIPIADTIYEHRTYLPSFGFFLVVGTGINIFYRSKYKIPAVALLVVILLTNSVMAYQRNKVWKDEFTLWNDAVTKSPGKARPYCNRGLANAKLQQTGKAIADYSRAIEICPVYAVAYSNRGVAYGTLGQWDKALADYNKALGVDTGVATVYYNRGCIYGYLGQMEKALSDYSKAIEIDPGSSDSYCNRGGIFWNLGQHDKAIADFTRAIEINPRLAQAYINRGGVYGSLGRYDKATEDLSLAIRITPRNQQAYFNRGITYTKTGEWNNAISDLSKTIEMNPHHARAYFYRGEAYRNSGLIELSIADYSKALEIDPNYSEAYTSRNAAYQSLNK
ncbi:MAG TPA: tetratricopeptide repeat protein [Bacteroidales bacterium]|nr:tetratricopeptide repeat protein [Bacteroidales bacterium]